MNIHLITPNIWPINHRRRDHKTETILNQSRESHIYKITEHLSLVNALPIINKLNQ